MKENGYMTIYLALTLGVMISLCLALIEGCRYRGICLETECVMDIGMDKYSGGISQGVIRPV